MYQKRKKTQPNIILILTDNQGWGDLSCYGNTNVETPNINRLAETGVTFEHFYVCAVCSPTRAELLTGRYHVRGSIWSTGAGGERLDLDETTLADMLKKQAMQLLPTESDTTACRLPSTRTRVVLTIITDSVPDTMKITTIQFSTTTDKLLLAKVL